MSERPIVAYKLADAVEWAALERDGRYRGSALDAADGYIHLSDAGQLDQTAARHFTGRTGLVLATIDLTVPGQTVRWEPSRGGALFPHLYGEITPDMVLTVEAVSVDADGRITRTGPTR